MTYRRREIQGDTGRYREIQGDTGRYREIQGDTGSAPGEENRCIRQQLSIETFASVLSNKAGRPALMQIKSWHNLEHK
jgi:hypothetical protein